MLDALNMVRVVDTLHVADTVHMVLATLKFLSHWGLTVFVLFFFTMKTITAITIPKTIKPPNTPPAILIEIPVEEASSSLQQYSLYRYPQQLEQ